MGIDGPSADLELLAELPVGQPAGNESQDLDLTRGQAICSRHGGVGNGSCGRICHARRSEIAGRRGSPSASYAPLPLDVAVMKLSCVLDDLAHLISRFIETVRSHEKPHRDGKSFWGGRHSSEPNGASKACPMPGFYQLIIDRDLLATRRSRIMARKSVRSGEALVGDQTAAT